MFECLSIVGYIEEFCFRNVFWVIKIESENIFSRAPRTAARNGDKIYGYANYGI